MTAPMNTAPLETFATDVALVMAGMLTNSDSAEGLSPEQLGVVLFSSIAAHAKTLPDYDESTDVSDVVKLGVAVYGEAVYASVMAVMSQAQDQVEEREALEAANQEVTTSESLN